MFWGRERDGLKSTYAYAREVEGRKGVPQNRINTYQWEVGLKLINLESTYFLNGLIRK